MSWSERAEKVINRVNAAFPNPDHFENWTICEELLSATAAYQQINPFQIKTDNFSFPSSGFTAIKLRNIL
jgi:hypothetical protein